MGLVESSRGRWFAVIALGVLASVVETLGAVLIFLLFKIVSDPASVVHFPLVGDLGAGVRRSHRDLYLIDACGIIGAFFVLRGVLLLLQIHVQYRMAHAAAARVARRLLAGYLAMDYSLLLRRSSAELIRNANDSIAVLSNFALVPAITIASEAMVIFGMFVVLVVVSPVATFVACGCIGALMLGAMKIVQPRLGRLGRRTQEKAGACIRALQESLQGVKDVKLFGRREGVVAEFARHRDDLSRSLYLQATLAAVPRLVLETSFVLVMLAFIVASGLSGTVKSGTLAILGLFGYAMLRLMPAVNRILLSVNNLKYGTAAADLIHEELVAIRQGVEGRSASDQRWGAWNKLTLSEVSYRYPETAWWTLEDLNLTVSRGEFVAIVGPTGSGKSTLLDLLVGLLPPTAGRLGVDGLNVHDQVEAWQQDVGVVSQTVFLIDDSLLHNIAFGVRDEEIDHQRVEEIVRMARLDEFVASLPEGLDTGVGEHAVRLSGGQRQRVAIARALYRRPTLLVLDEGTSALDQLTEAEIIRALEPLRGELTLVAAAHRMATVRNCDRLVVLKGGRITDEGSFEEIVTRNAGLWPGGADLPPTAVTVPAPSGRVSDPEQWRPRGLAAGDEAVQERQS